jgi:hypothetical protein
VLVRLTRWLALPAALAAGIVLQIEYPGDFGPKLHDGGPGLATWIALWGGLAALAAAAVLARRRAHTHERLGPLAALATLLFVLPVAVHGFAHWEASTTADRSALTPGLVRFLRADVPRGAVVFADLETSYRISAYVPVYVANGPPAHVADTKANRPAARRLDLLHFLEHGNLAIPRRYHAGWLVLRTSEHTAAPGTRPVYRDDRFVVFAL